MSAADFPALVRDVTTGERAPCGGDDVNADMRVDGGDIEALPDAVFTTVE